MQLYAALCSLQCAMLHDLRRALCSVLCAVLHAACGTQNMRHNLYPLFWFVAPYATCITPCVIICIIFFLLASVVGWHTEHAS